MFTNFITVASEISLVQVKGLEPLCNQLPFQRLIRASGYTWVDLVCLNIAVSFCLGDSHPPLHFFVVRDGTAPPSPGSKPSVLTSILTDIKKTEVN